MKQKIKSMMWPTVVLVAMGLLLGGYLLAAGNKTAGIPTQVQPHADGTVSVLFRGTPGNAYQVQAADVAVGGWNVVASNVVAIAGWTEWVDASPVPGQRYYRVISQPAVAASATALAVTSAPKVSSSTTQEAADATSAVALVLASTSTVSSPTTQEATDTKQLLAALNTGDNQTVLNILAEYGISTNTLSAMAGRLGQTPRVTLQEPFLKAAASLSLDGRTSDIRTRLNIAYSLGYSRPIWVARSLSTNWTARCDAELAQTTIAPIGALDVGLNDASLIRYFQWYDRYAEQLHSVALNWQQLNTHDIDPSQYGNVNVELSGLYKLIKARKPDAFVWVGVVKQDSGVDIPWLQSLTFRPDGLFVANLRQFHSSFAKTRQRYLPIVGADMPMVVVGFYGYRPEMKAAGQVLSAAKKIQDSAVRQPAKAQAMVKITAMGQVIEPQLSEEEQHLKNLGYRGLVANWRLLEAVAAAKQQTGN